MLITLIKLRLAPAKRRTINKLVLLQSNQRLSLNRWLLNPTSNLLTNLPRGGSFIESIELRRKSGRLVFLVIDADGTTMSYLFS